MRTTKLVIITALAAVNLLGCTVKDVDTPPLAGPSSLARTIVMRADRDTLVQDGVSEAAISLSAIVQPGQSENVRLRAQVFVDGIAQDFGTLSNKSPITPTTIFYRAPAAPVTSGPQTPTVVTVAVIPDDQGDFNGEHYRFIDIRLIPPGVLLPVNPNLVADFTVTPASPRVMDTVTFNGTPTTNNGAACLSGCLYSWNFGDGTTASGLTPTHQYRTARNYVVTLVVTDSRGATAQIQKELVVGEGTPPTVPAFTMSPTPAGPNQDVFFSANGARPAPGRTIVSYEWSFGDGNTGVGVTTTHRYIGAGTYQVALKVTDDAGAFTLLNQTLVVSVTAGTTAAFVVEPASPRVGQNAVFNASSSVAGTGSTIVTYTFNFGDGTVITSATPIQSYVYTAPGITTASVEVTDSLGRKHLVTRQITVTP